MDTPSLPPFPWVVSFATQEQGLFRPNRHEGLLVQPPQGPLVLLKIPANNPFILALVPDCLQELAPPDPQVPHLLVAGGCVQFSPG